MSNDQDLQQRASTLATLATVYKSLFIDADSAAVQSHFNVLQQTKLVGYESNAPSQVLCGRARQCTVLLPGPQRVKVSVERDLTEDRGLNYSHLSLLVQYDGNGDRRWIVVKSAEAGPFDTGLEPEYEDHSEHMQSHQGTNLLREILVRAGLLIRGHPLGLLAILFVCFQDEDVLEILDEWPNDFDEQPDSGDTMKMGWPETVAQACLQTMNDSESDLDSDC